jgi:hypothetical protein
MYEFTFELYDPEMTGELQFGQVRSLINIIHDAHDDAPNEKKAQKHAPASLKKQLKQFLDILGIHDEARITRKAFVGICEKFPMLVSPVVDLQVLNCILNYMM